MSVHEEMLINQWILMDFTSTPQKAALQLIGSCDMLCVSNIDLVSCHPIDGAFEDDVAQNLVSQSRYVGRKNSSSPAWETCCWEANVFFTNLSTPMIEWWCFYSTRCLKTMQMSSSLLGKRVREVRDYNVGMKFTKTIGPICADHFESLSSFPYCFALEVTLTCAVSSERIDT